MRTHRVARAEPFAALHRGDGINPGAVQNDDRTRSTLDAIGFRSVELNAWVGEIVATRCARKDAGCAAFRDGRQLGLIQEFTGRRPAAERTIAHVNDRKGG
jgi:hypothetical protein